MCGFACGDPRAVPSAAAPPDLQAELDAADGVAAGSSVRNGGGRGTAAPSPQQQQEELAAQALALARRGGEAVLQAMARQAGQGLQQRLPKLWEQASAPLAALQQAGVAADLQSGVQALHVLGVLAPAVHVELAPQLAALLPLVVACLQRSNTALKLAAARCVAALAVAHTAALMPHTLRLMAPLLTGKLLPGGTVFSGAVLLWCCCWFATVETGTAAAHRFAASQLPPHPPSTRLQAALLMMRG